jgi:hypothetical protein
VFCFLVGIWWVLHAEGYAVVKVAIRHIAPSEIQKERKR